MLPDPLHPSIVHFPIVLGIVLPVVAAYVLWRLHDGAHPRLWRLVALLALLVWGSGWVGEATGERDEERVEETLGGHDAIHEHHDAAELFMVMSGVVFGLALVGLVPGVTGRVGRLLTLVGALAVAGGVARAGMLGGELVYEKGAAAAYRSTGAVDAPPVTPVTDADSVPSSATDDDSVPSTEAHEHDE